jgi:hypothetical protein
MEATSIHLDYGKIRNTYNQSGVSLNIAPRCSLISKRPQFLLMCVYARLV